MDSEQIADMNHYMWVAKKTLSKLLGWSRPQITDWLDQHYHDWEDYHCIYVCEKPEYWVTDALIPDSLRERMAGPAVKNLKRDIVSTLELGNLLWYNNASYDWGAARQRIDHLLARYGAI
jgi:hypothetical protein